MSQICRAILAFLLLSSTAYAGPMTFSGSTSGVFVDPLGGQSKGAGTSTFQFGGSNGATLSFNQTIPSFTATSGVPFQLGSISITTGSPVNVPAEVTMAVTLNFKTPTGLGKETFDFAVGAIFALVETLMMCGSTVSLIFLARLGDRTADADRNAAWLATLSPQPLVDVFICTYNEEAAILERTIIGAQSMDYPRYRVWVLDDGRRPWLAQLCEREGCRYLTRADNSRAPMGLTM